MKLKELSMSYFMHYGRNQRIKFTNEKLISIVGHWADNPSRSNKAGKSSFIEAITYCLWGETRAKSEKELINVNYDEDMWVQLVFEIDGVGYTLKRGRTTNNKPIIELTGYEENKEIQTVIDKLIGMTYKDFIATCFFMQGDIHTFMDASNPDKNKYILKWFERDYWQRLEESAKGKVKEAKLIVDKIIFELETLCKVVETLEDLAQQKSDLIEEKQELEDQAEPLVKKIESLKALVKQIELKQALEKGIRTCESTMTRLEEQMEDIDEDIKTSSEIDARIKLVESKLVMPNSESFKKLQQLERNLISEKATFEAKRDQLKITYAKIAKFKGYCETLEMACPNAGNSKEKLSKIKVNGQELNEDISAIEVKLSETRKEIKILQKAIDDYKDQLSEVSRLKASMSDIEALKIKKKNLFFDFDNQQKALEEFQEQLNGIKDVDSDIMDELKSYEQDYTDLVDKIGELKSAISVTESKVQNAKEAAKRVAQLHRRELPKTEKELTHWQYIAFMFGKNGIPSNLIESTFEEIQDEVNIILEKLRTDLQVEFSNSKELAQWESHCLICGYEFPKGMKGIKCPQCESSKEKKRKNELQVKIIDGGKESLFHMDSGGGKVLLSIAIRIALTRILFRRLGIKFNILILDEIFAQLDTVNRDHVIYLITNYLVNEMGFEQIFIISHTDIKNTIPNTILVKRFEEYSEVEWMN